jgi:phospholipase C
VAAFVAVSAGAKGRDDHNLRKIDHIVVIYEENHSFDNLYGGWEGVNGRANATAAQITQVNQAGTPFTCLKQLDVNLTSPPLAATCNDATTATPFSSAFTNTLFDIGSFIPTSAQTCPQPGVFAPNGLLPSAANLPGGCTRDIVHRFYQEQYQLNNGKQNRYTTGSDAAGLTQGFYDTKALPIYQYLHSNDHPSYVIADDFFQGAFGGSFLNHQWLISARAPTWATPVNDGSANDLHSIIDANGFPNATYPFYHPATTVKDSQLTQQCGLPTTVAGFACGDFAVNTSQPAYQPFQPGTPAARLLPPLHTPTIGDELSAAGASWAWYSGGWNNAAGVIGGPGWTNGDGPTCTDPQTFPGAGTGSPAVFPNCPNALFQFHHQPFNYFFNFRPGTFARQEHLRDEAEFMQLAQSSTDHTCNLKDVSFVKPIGLENEHPGYTSVSEGSNHLVQLLKTIEGSSCAKDTLVLVTYDEFGGQFDHVAPPGQGGVQGAHDQWGPGTRVPALFVVPNSHDDDFAVDHTQYDTTSILATIEHRYHLAPLSTRDAAVNDFSNVFDAKEPKKHDDGDKKHEGGDKKKHD